ncbi:J domain-containing protein [Pseudarthrobacter sulfonivorans]|uniref:J domain-containing protein n=1 Tax=Pseudarthrobacter sulfonivorans TaxID=121292 RepID=UPI002866C255|nr:J domain-containing protein [Pseudarthrobacter sulfonivorans]MDR6415125.1 DnaJ-class molecular chaperone [Pseudarthrobacter sulfonivorans]
MTSKPDYYDVLRVKPAASQQEISRAYRALMRTHHPDLDGGRADGGDLNRGALLQIMQAFSVLRDPARRAAYDRNRTSTSTIAQGAGPIVIPVRKGAGNVPAGNTIRITPVRWESGPWTETAGT